MSIKLNVSKFPLVSANVVGYVTVNDLKNFLGELTNLFERKRKFKLVCNVKKMSGSVVSYGSEHINTLSSWMSDNDRQTKLYMEKTIILMQNMVIKMILQIVFKIKKPNSEFHFVERPSQVRQFLK